MGSTSLRSDTLDLPRITADDLPSLLAEDVSVKVAGIDIDGVLRGKLMSKKKFLSVAAEGFGFCSVIFGWDLHDKTYFRELAISNKENGYRDILAVPDLQSFRRIPWEDNVPFFLVSFFDPDTHEPLSACSRGLLSRQVGLLAKKGMGAMAGGAYIEFLISDYLLFLLCPFSTAAVETHYPLVLSRGG